MKVDFIWQGDEEREGREKGKKEKEKENQTYTTKLYVLNKR